MAKSAADHDDKDEKKKDPAEGEEAASKDDGAGDEGDAEAKKPTDDEEEEEEAKPVKAAAPAAKASGPVKRTAARPGAKALVKKAPQKGGSLGKSVILFVIIVGGLAAGFAILGREEHTGGPVKPKWTMGQTVDVEITLVKTDSKELTCAAADEVAGKHCAFEAQNKPWSKGDNTDDKKVLKPYTTTDRIQFVGAGLWAEPNMAQDKLPGTRFSVKCKYKVEGMVKKLDIRWESTGQWFPNGDWFAGALTECKVQP